MENPPSPTIPQQPIPLPVPSPTPIEPDPIPQEQPNIRPIPTQPETRPVEEPMPTALPPEPSAVKPTKQPAPDALQHTDEVTTLKNKHGGNKNDQNKKLLMRFWPLIIIVVFGLILLISGILYIAVLAPNMNNKPKALPVKPQMESTQTVNRPDVHPDGSVFEGIIYETSESTQSTPALN